MHVNNSADNIAFYLTINILNTTFPPLTHPFPCSKQKRARARNDFTWSQNLVGFYCSSGSCLNSNFPLFILYRDRLLSIALRVDLPYSVDLLISVLPGKCTYDNSVRSKPLHLAARRCRCTGHNYEDSKMLLKKLASSWGI